MQSQQVEAEHISPDLVGDKRVGVALGQVRGNLEVEERVDHRKRVGQRAASRKEHLAGRARVQELAEEPSEAVGSVQQQAEGGLKIKPDVGKAAQEGGVLHKCKSRMDHLEVHLRVQGTRRREI